MGLPQTGRQEATVDPLSEDDEQRDHPLTFPLVAASDVTHHVVVGSLHSLTDTHTTYDVLRQIKNLLLNGFKVMDFMQGTAISKATQQRHTARKSNDT